VIHIKNKGCMRTSMGNQADSFDRVSVTGSFAKVITFCQYSTM